MRGLAYLNMAMGGFNLGAFTFGSHLAVSLGAGLFSLIAGVLIGSDT